MEQLLTDEDFTPINQSSAPQNDRRLLTDDDFQLASESPQKAPQSGEFADYLWGTGTHSNALSAFGQGAKKGYGVDPIGLTPDSEKELIDRGFFDKYKETRGNHLKAANEAWMRPAVQPIVTRIQDAKNWADIIQQKPITPFGQTSPGEMATVGNKEVSLPDDPYGVQKAFEVQHAAESGLPVPKVTSENKHGAWTRGLVSGVLASQPELLAATLDGLSFFKGPNANPLIGTLSEKERAEQDKPSELLQGLSREATDLSKLSPEEYKPIAKTPSLSNLTDIDNLLTWAGETSGQGVASSILPFVGGLAGGAVGGPIGAKWGAAGPSFVLNYGDIYQQLVKAGVPKEDASQYAMAAAVPVVGLDIINPVSWANKFTGVAAAQKKARNEAVKAILKELGVSGVTEAGTEGTQQGITAATVSTATGKPFLTKENVKEIALNAVGGALGGGPMGAVAEAGSIVQGNRAAGKQEEAGRVDEYIRLRERQTSLTSGKESIEGILTHGVANGIIGQRASIAPPSEDDIIARAEATGNLPDPALDIQRVARGLDPEAFRVHDETQAELEGIRQEIKTLQESQIDNPRYAELQTQIDTMSSRRELTNVAKERLIAAKAELEVTPKKLDTPELAALRQKLLETQHRLFDLGPTISHLNRTAAEHVKTEREARGETEAVDPVQTIRNWMNPDPALQPDTEETTEDQTLVNDEESIKNIVTQKVLATGRSLEEATAAGILWEARYKTVAKRLRGKFGTPLDVFNRFDPDVIGEDTWTDRSGSSRVVSQFIGGRAFQGTPEGARLEGLRNTAEDMEAAGKDTDAIRLATGWERSPLDGHWKLELSDKGMKIKNQSLFDTMGSWEDVTLGEVVDHPELFKAYPELKDVKVTRSLPNPDWGSFWMEAGGWFDAANNTINVVPGMPHPREVLTHEIQHWIQEKEGFAKGGDALISLMHMTQHQRESFRDFIKALSERRIQLETSFRPKSYGFEFDKGVQNVLTLQNEATSLDDDYQATGTPEDRLALMKSIDKAMEAREELLSKYFQGFTDEMSSVDRTVRGEFENALRTSKDLTEFTEQMRQLSVQFREAADAAKATIKSLHLLMSKDVGKITRFRDSLSPDIQQRLYERVSGEIEAADSTNRMNMSTGERKRTPRNYGDPKDYTVSVYNQEVSPEPFYSALERAIEALPDTTMTGKEWLNRMYSPEITQKVPVRDGKNKIVGLDGNPLPVIDGKTVGEPQTKDKTVQARMLLPEVTLEEFEVRNLKEFLQDTADLPVSKADILEMLSWADNMIEVGETMRGGNGEQTKWSGQTTPGGKNYRELLLTNNSKRYGVLKAEEVLARAEERYKAATLAENKQDYLWRIRKDPKVTEESLAAGDALRVAQENLDLAKEAFERDSFQSSHFPEKNILAHIRFDERIGPNGERVLHIAEIQSDWHQQGRKRGYKSSKDFERLEALKLEYEAAKAAYDENSRQTDLASAAWDASMAHKRAVQEQYGWNSPEQKEAQQAYEDRWNELQEVRKQWTPLFEKRNSLRNEVNQLQRDASGYGKVADAPFKKTWNKLAFKRMVRYAAENGFDAVSWETGKTQVDRYESTLRKKVQELHWEKTPEGIHLTGFKNVVKNLQKYDIRQELDGTWNIVDVEKYNEGYHIDLSRIEGPFHQKTEADEALLLKSGSKEKIIDTKQRESELSDAVGKAMADDIINSPEQSGTFSGDEIRIDNTGMAGFYDKMLPIYANELAKGHSKVVDGTMPSGKQYSITYVDEADNKRGYSVFDQEGKVWGFAKTEEEAKELVKQLYKTRPTVDIHTLPLTPGLKEKAFGGFPLFQGENKIVRGDLTITPEGQKNIIRIYRDAANASTFFHETGHQWLEELMYFASLPDTPAEIKSDAQIINTWLGRKKGQPLTTAQHEKFARGFERYLREGVAPSKELDGIFKQFKAWLESIYKTLKQLNSPINDEVRGVFDRMISISPEESVIIDREFLGGETQPTVLEQAKKTGSKKGKKSSTKSKSEGTESEGTPIPDEGSQFKTEPAAEEVPATEPFVEESTPRVDKAGKIDFKLVSNDEDIVKVITDIYTQNKDLLDKKRGKVSDQDRIDFAEAAGLKASDINTEFLEDMMTKDGIPLSVRIFGLKQMLVQSATEVKSLATGKDVLAFTEAVQRHVWITGTFVRARAEAGRALRNFRAVKTATEITDPIQLAEFLKANTGKTYQQIQELMQLTAKLPTQAAVSQFVQKMQDPSLGQMAFEIFLHGLISGPITQTLNTAGNRLSALNRYGPESLVRGAIGAVHQAFSSQKIDRAYMGESGASLYAMAFGTADALKAVGQSFKLGETLHMPGENSIPDIAFRKARAAGYEYGTSEFDVYFQDAKERLALKQAESEGIRDEIALAARVSQLINSNESLANIETPYDPTRYVPNYTVAGVPIPIGSIIRAPGERMVAPLNTLDRTLGYLTARAGLIYRRAMSEGLKGDAFALRIAELTANTPIDIAVEARDLSNKEALMNKPGPWVSSFIAFMSKEVKIPGLGMTPVGRWITPFISILADLQHQAFVERGPLWVLNQKVRDDLFGRNGTIAQHTAMASQLTGFALFMAIGGLIAQGLIGEPPTGDFEKDKIIQRTKGTPYSIRIGGMNYETSKLGILGLQIVASVNLWNMIEKTYTMGKTMYNSDDQEAINKSVSKAAGALMSSVHAAYYENGYISGIADFLKAVDGEGTAQWATGILVSTVMPFSVGMYQVSKLLDPYSRSVYAEKENNGFFKGFSDGLINSIQARTPGLSDDLFPKRDIWGQAVPNKEFRGTYAVEASQDPVDNLLLETETYPSPPSNKILGVELTPEQYDAYAQKSGIISKMMISQLVNDGQFGQLPAKVKHDLILNLIQSSREAAGASIQAEALGTENDIIRKAIEIKQKLATGTP